MTQKQVKVKQQRRKEREKLQGKNKKERRERNSSWSATTTGTTQEKEKWEMKTLFCTISHVFFTCVGFSFRRATIRITSVFHLIYCHIKYVFGWAVYCYVFGFCSQVPRHKHCHGHRCHFFAMTQTLIFSSDINWIVFLCVCKCLANIFRGMRQLIRAPNIRSL